MEIPQDNLQARWSPKKYSARWGFFRKVEGQSERKQPLDHEPEDIAQVPGEVFRTALDVIRYSGRRAYSRTIKGFEKTLYCVGKFHVLYQSCDGSGLETIEVAGDSRSGLVNFASFLDLSVC